MQNCVSDSDWLRIVSGSEFHNVGPETAKHLWLYLVVLEHGTARSPRAVFCTVRTDLGTNDSELYPVD